MPSNYSQAALSSHETTGFTADKAMFVAKSVDPSIVTAASWNTNGTDPAGNDDTDATTPAARAYDGIGSPVTKLDSNTTSTTYFNIDFTTFIAAFDVFGVIGHNFKTDGVSVLSLEISDTSNFTGSTAVEIFSKDVTALASDTRFFCFNLNNAGGSTDAYSAGGTAQRYSDVRYLRVKLTTSGTIRPEIGEFFFGQRYQLSRNPNNPFDNKSTSSSVSDFESKSGAMRRYVMNKGRASRTIALSTDDSTEISEIDAFWSDCQFGTEPFLWVETPSSAPLGYLVYAESTGLDFPLVGPTERALTMRVIEQPAYLANE